MMVFLLIAFVVLFTGTVTMKFYAGDVPLLGVLSKVFISITVVEGAIMVIIIGIYIYNEVKKK